MRRMGTLDAYSSASFHVCWAIDNLPSLAFSGKGAWTTRRRAIRHSRDSLTIFLPTTYISELNILSLCCIYISSVVCIASTLIAEVNVLGFAPPLLQALTRSLNTFEIVLTLQNEPGMLLITAPRRDKRFLGYTKHSTTGLSTIVKWLLGIKCIWWKVLKLVWKL
jgi:hypothetical protein